MLNLNKLSVILLPLLMLMVGNVQAQGFTPLSLQSVRAVHTQTVTNGQAVTLYTGINLLTAAGQADAYTNTITIANSALSSSGYAIINAVASTNLIAIAKSGNWKSAAVELAAGDMVLIISSATNAFHSVK